ncbi:TPA: hypothetical protein HA241_00895 [Candidatus Woesearchaeota archaeon]|nr:hypothetical protein [Candidatus Woesearchaeota archaeon]
MTSPVCIRDEFESNPAVVVVNVNHYFHSVSRPDTYGNNILHSVEFNIAPKRGLYTAGELQGFMEELITDFIPTSTINFKVQDNYLYFGQLCFSEQPVVEYQDKQTVVDGLSDRLFLPVYADLLMYGQVVLDASLYHRRTLVRLFPSRKYVEDILPEKLPTSRDRISLPELRRLKPLFRWFERD